MNKNPLQPGESHLAGRVLLCPIGSAQEKNFAYCRGVLTSGIAVLSCWDPALRAGTALLQAPYTPPLWQHLRTELHTFSYPSSSMLEDIKRWPGGHPWKGLFADDQSHEDEIFGLGDILDAVRFAIRAERCRAGFDDGFLAVVVVEGFA